LTCFDVSIDVIKSSTTYIEATRDRRIMNHNIEVIEIVWIFKEFGIYSSMSLVRQVVMMVVHVDRIMISRKDFNLQRRTHF